MELSSRNMHRRYFYIVVVLTALCLLLILIFFTGQKKSSSPQYGATGWPVPYPACFQGVGIVEPQSGSIYIGIPYNRIVKKVNVSVNDPVHKGDLLLELEHEDLTAQLSVKQSEYEKSVANFERLGSLPRKEDLVIALEALNQAQSSFNEAQSAYEMVLNLPQQRGISQDEQNRRLYRFQQAEAQLKESQAQFEKVQSGAWEPELEIAAYEVEQAKAAVEAIQTEIERTSIRSPIDGTVLQIKIHEGEIANADPTKALLILGSIDQLNIRASFDQFNVSTLNPKASSVAYRQGDPSVEYPLEFLYVEQVMIPKKYVTNAVGERVDTQVFEVLYRIAKKDAHLFIGEQMNVYICHEQ